MEAFATHQQFAKLLNRTLVGAPEEEWITDLLEKASTYLREDVIGQQVYPQSTSTFKAWPEPNGAVVLPQAPVIEVASVTSGGSPIEFEHRDNYVLTGTTDQVEVTFTYGFEVAPEGLARWCMVLVSSALLPLEQKLGLTAGGLSSVAIDDFKIAWADAGAESGMTLSDRNIELIRKQYSTGDAAVTEARR